MRSLVPAILIASLLVPFASAMASSGTLFGPPQGGPHAAYEEGQYRYHYDRNGNLIRREEKTSGIVTRRYRYTTTGHLQKQDLTDHIYDAEGNKLASVLRDGTIVSYLHGTRFKQGARGEIPKVLFSFGDAELSEQQELQFFLTDHLSTVTGMATRLGLEEVKDHQPYGQGLFLKTDSLPSVERTEHDFTGNELQDEHLDYLARQMVPGEARFLQPDPTIPSLQLPLAYNRYAYVYGNPVNLIDPTGHAGLKALEMKNFKRLFEVGMRLGEYLKGRRAGEIALQEADLTKARMAQGANEIAAGSLVPASAIRLREPLAPPGRRTYATHAGLMSGNEPGLMTEDVRWLLFPEPNAHSFDFVINAKAKELHFVLPNGNGDLRDSHVGLAAHLLGVPVEELYEDPSGAAHLVGGRLYMKRTPNEDLSIQFVIVGPTSIQTCSSDPGKVVPYTRDVLQEADQILTDFVSRGDIPLWPGVESVVGNSSQVKADPPFSSRIQTMHERKP